MATYWENSCSFGLRYVSWYKYLIVCLVFSHLGFWSGNLFLIAPFPDLCLLVPFCKLPDDGDPWAPNNLLTPKQKKNTSWTPVGQATDLTLPVFILRAVCYVLSLSGDAKLYRYLFLFYTLQ